MDEGCRAILLSPFEIHFSQTRIRPEFQDGRTLDETTLQLSAVPWRQGGEEGAEDMEAELDEEAEDLSEFGAGDVLLMRVPFPRIEVIRWRCKLRDADGTPKVDPSTGLNLYSKEERWFTFDNRRLCCMQRFATTLWPQQVRCEVIELSPSVARTRELRKFDTRTLGQNITVARRDEPAIDVWCWRTAVGLPQKQLDDDAVGLPHSLRWRGVKPHRGATSSSSSRKARGGREAPEVENHTGELLRSGMLFLVVYLGLRVAFSVFRHREQLWALLSSTEPAGPPTLLPER